MLRANLKVVGGKQDGSLIPLQTKKFLVGREQDCQLRPVSESVSRHHCVFSTDDFGVRLRDLGSTNGTFVNGKRLQGQIVLKPGDRILIGKLEFQILIHDAVLAMQHARVASSMLSDSSSGFMLTDLAEMPENAGTGTETMVNISPTEILGGENAFDSTHATDTQILSSENTALMPSPAPTSPKPMPTEVELPVMAAQPQATLMEAPLAPAEPPPPPPLMPMQAAPGMPMPPQGMPMPGAPMMQPPMPQPYGMPGAYPQPQPQYIQAPFAGYAPQYMPNPYGMQQPYMPQQYDPAYQQQMAYQQQLAQQQMAQQQALIAAQFAAQPGIAPLEEIGEEMPEEPIDASAAPPIKLPPPEETGAKPPAPPPPPAPTVEGAPPAAPTVKPNQLAADIIKKYMNRS